MILKNVQPLGNISGNPGIISTLWGYPTMPCTVVPHGKAAIFHPVQGLSTPNHFEKSTPLGKVV